MSVKRFTQERREQLLQLMRDGLPLYRAREEIRLSDATLRAWLRKARRGEPEASAFAQAYALAKLAPKQRRLRPDQIHARAAVGLIEAEEARQQLEEAALHRRSVSAMALLLRYYCE